MLSVGFRIFRQLSGPGKARPGRSGARGSGPKQYSRQRAPTHGRLKRDPLSGGGVSGPRGGKCFGQLCGRTAATQRRTPTALGTSGRSQARASPTHVPRSHRQRGAKPPEAARAQAGRELLAEERRRKLLSPTDSPDSFVPSSCSAVWGVLGSESALAHASERSKPARGTLLAAAVQAATKTFGQRTSRREKTLPRGRRRQPPEAARTRKGRHFVPQQRRRKLSSPTAGRCNL